MPNRRELPLSSASSRRGGRSLAWLACALPLPVIFLLVCLRVRHTPLSTFVYADATYIYVLDAFAVSLGNWASCGFHPGATLHWWGGFVAWWRNHFGPNQGTLTMAALLPHHAEAARALGDTLIAFNTILLGLAGIIFHRRGIPVLGVILLQLLWINAPDFLAFVGLYQPEAAYVGISAALAIALLGFERTCWPAWSVITGAAIATKLYYAPFLTGLFSLSSRRQAAKALAASAAVFLLLCLIVLPAWETLFRFFGMMAVTSGDYDNGAIGLPSGQTIARALAWADQFYLLYICVPLLALVYVAVTYRPGEPEKRKRFLAASYAFFLALAFFLRKPTHNYYVLPALGALPGMLAAYLLLVEKNWRRWLGYATALLLLGLYGASFPRRLEQRLGFLHDADTQIGRLEDTLARNRQCAVLTQGTLPLAENALRLGAMKKWDAEISALFPGFTRLDENFQVIQPAWREPDSLWLQRIPNPCVFLVAPPWTQQELLRRSTVAAQGKMRECNTFYCLYEYSRPGR